MEESIFFETHVAQYTTEIKALLGRTAQNIVTIGEKLQAVKAELEHGQWEAWLQQEFNWSLASALKIIQVSERFKSVNITDLRLDVSALYLLAAPSTPAAAADEAIARAQQGEAITPTRAKAIVNKHRGVETLPSTEKPHKDESDATPRRRKRLSGTQMRGMFLDTWKQLDVRGLSEEEATQLKRAFQLYAIQIDWIRRPRLEACPFTDTWKEIAEDIAFLDDKAAEKLRGALLHYPREIDFEHAMQKHHDDFWAKHQPLPPLNHDIFLQEPETADVDLSIDADSA